MYLMILKISVGDQILFEQQLKSIVKMHFMQEITSRSKNSNFSGISLIGSANVIALFGSSHDAD